MKRLVASAATLTLASLLGACAGDIDTGTPGVSETPFALGNPDLRIAVVGAGPSGLEAAHELVARGYSHVTVFEREDHVGGKVNTANILGNNVDLGAVFVSDDYTLTRGLAHDYGFDAVAFTTPRYIYDQGDKLDFQSYLLKHYSIADITSATIAYAGVLQTFHPWIAADALDHLPADLMLNFDAFAAKYKIGPVADVAKSLIVGFGYGYYDTVPAIYELKILNMLVKVGPTGLFSPTYYSFPTGFQAVWQAVAADLPDVRLYSNVTKIERPSRAGQPIKLTVNGLQTLDFDAVIVSAPLSQVPRFVTLSAAEKALFSKVETSRYFISIFFMFGAPTGEAVFVQDNAVSSRIDHPVVWANPGGGVPVYQAYQIADKLIPASLLTLLDLIPDMHSLTGSGVALPPIKQKEWPDYFPRVSSAAMQAGFYNDVEALQGNGGLYYVGGTLSFETVETSARYAKSLVDAHFASTTLVAP